jgi:hypothetical protein
MNDNPYESPQGETSTPLPNADGLRLAGRIVVGFFGGTFAAPALWVAIVYWTGQWNLAELLVIPAWIVGALVAGWTAYSSCTPMRVGAWAFAGLGIGFCLEAVLSGGLGVGTWLTLSGIVLGLVFAVLGYRRAPEARSLPTPPAG